MLRLTPTAKLVINYMAIRHLVDGATYVTFKELVERLGISERRLRALMQELRQAGLVEAYINPSRGRALLYRLAFNNFNFDSPIVEPGLYYIDLPPNAKIPGDLTLRTFSIKGRLSSCSTPPFLPIERAYSPSRNVRVL